MNKDIYQTLLHEWLDKTNWVQETAQVSELGLHRGDVILNRFRELETQRDDLLEALKSTRAFINSVAPHGSLLERVNATINQTEGMNYD